MPTGVYKRKKIKKTERKFYCQLCSKSTSEKKLFKVCEDCLIDLKKIKGKKG